MIIRSYVRTLVHSFTSTEPYVSLLKRSWWRTFGFFAVSMLLLGISSSFYFQKRTIPTIEQKTDQVVDEAKQHYPTDLKISWDGQQLHSSSDAPVAITYPSLIQPDPQLPSTLAYLLPKDVTSDQLTTALPSSSVVAITPHEIYVNDLHGNWTSTPLTTLLNGSFTIAPETLDVNVNQIKSTIHDTLQLIGEISLIVAPFYLIIEQLFVAFIQGLLIFLVYKLYRAVMPLSKSWQLALHISVVAEAVTQLTNWLYPGTHLPMYSLTFWLVFVYVTWTRQAEFKRGFAQLLKKNK